ncbi:DUF4493 domain-containing protein [Phocaeicola plebeius]
MGTFTMSLNATSEVIGLNDKSRADQETGKEEALVLPDVNDFSVSISSLGEQVCGWSSYKDMSEEEMPELRVGTYQVKAWYGDVSKEGFELPYFEGNQEFVIKKNETTPVEVTCYLGNAQVKVNYTDEFKNYFSDYSAVMATSLGNEVEYVKDETRAAYFSPGELTAKVKVKKSGQSTENVYQVKVFEAKARHIYLLTLDVEAGSATMTVSFSDDVAGEEVRFDVSDAALNSPAPYFKANGFTESVPFQSIEGAEPKEQVTAYVNAVAGIQSCRLTTTSGFLSGKGWPDVVDLAAPGKYASILTEMGLETKGLEGNRDQMAQVNFTKLIKNLPTGGNHIFKLEATDVYGKVSDTPLVLTVTPQGCEFAVAATSTEAPFYGNTCQVNVSFKDGDPANVHFQLMEGNKEALEFIRAEELSSEGGLKIYTVYLKAPETVKFMDPFKISASYLSYTKETDKLPVSMGILVDSSGDVWAKKAVFHVYNETELADIKLQKQQGGSWMDVTTEVNGSYGLTAKGLESGASVKLRAVKGKEYSNSVDITTEEELQVPNAGFEDFYDEYVWKGINVTGGNVDMYTFYPYAKGETDPWWSSRNALTTAEEGAGDFSYYYIVYPATTYVNSSWAASSKVGLPTVPCSGDKSAEIASIGWGKGSTCTTGLLGNKMSCKKTIAGALFIGTYTNGEEHHGHEFSSRPQKMTFSYRFHSYNSESASATIRLEHRDGDLIYVLAEKELILTPDMVSNEVQTGELALDYNEQSSKYKATHISISFLSSTADSPAYEPFYVADNWNGNRYSRAIGNVLVIDDVKLIYE